MARYASVFICMIHPRYGTLNIEAVAPRYHGYLSTPFTKQGTDIFPAATPFDFFKWKNRNWKLCSLQSASGDLSKWLLVHNLIWLWGKMICNIVPLQCVQFSLDGISLMFEYTCIYMPQNIANKKSTLVQIMAWCRVRKQAITGANIDPDLCRHTASLGHNKLRG